MRIFMLSIFISSILYLYRCCFCGCCCWWWTTFFSIDFFFCSTFFYWRSFLPHCLSRRNISFKFGRSLFLSIPSAPYAVSYTGGITTISHDNVVFMQVNKFSAAQASEKLRRLIKLDLTHTGNDVESVRLKSYISLFHLIPSSLLLYMCISVSSHLLL